jgi:hypothetical protein
MRSLDPWSIIAVDASGDVVWPRPRYGNAFYREVPSWIHYGDDDRHRLLFDGAFIGAEGPPAGADDPLQMLEMNTMMQPYVGHYMGADTSLPSPPPPEPRRGLLAEVAPHVAPATGPISVKKMFDERQVLHVEVCVDGKCYRTSMNLGPAIQLVMEKLAQWHRAQHASPGAPDTTTVVGSIDDAIVAAGDAMADTLVCHHVNVMAAGFFDDLGSAIGGTLRKLEPAISTAATAVATYYGGSEAGAAAGKLAPVVTNIQANLLDPKGDSQQRAVAQQNLRQVTQVAQANPHAAQALRIAQRAVNDTAVAYHVKDAVDKAATGDRAAQQQVAAVVRAADSGDPAAKSTYEIIAQTLLNQAQQSEWGQQLWNKIMGRDTTVAAAGWYSAPVTVGGFWDDVGNAVLTVTGTKATNQFIQDHGLGGYVDFAAKAVATYYGGPAAGAAAGAISPMVRSLGVEDKSKAAAAQQDVQGIKNVAAQHSPEMVRAVDVAQGSVQGVATAYHLNHMLKLARAGDPISQKTLALLRTRAATGDPSAQKAMQAIEAIRQGQQQAAAPVVSGWYDVVGAVIRAGGPLGHHRHGWERWAG